VGKKPTLSLDVGKEVPMKRPVVRLFVACLMGSWAVSAVWAEGPNLPIPNELIAEGSNPTGAQKAGDLLNTQGFCSHLDDRDPFRAGQWSFEYMSGYFVKSSWGPAGKNGANPPLDYVSEALRVGLMCNDPHPDWCVCWGVSEVLLEYNLMPVVRGPGHFFSGPCALLRYNWVRPECAIIPYMQIGAGFVLNDVWEEPVQHLIGEDFEFLLRVEGGVHVMLTESLSLNIEGGYQHISNACLATRNAGLNNLGVAIGFTWSFGR
jgi:hypothetical protein